MNTLLNDPDMGLLFCGKTKILVGRHSRIHILPSIKEELQIRNYVSGRVASSMKLQLYIYLGDLRGTTEKRAKLV